MTAPPVASLEHAVNALQALAAKNRQTARRLEDVDMQGIHGEIAATHSLHAMNIARFVKSLDDQTESVPSPEAADAVVDAVNSLREAAQ